MNGMNQNLIVSTAETMYNNSITICTTKTIFQQVLKTYTYKNSNDRCITNKLFYIFIHVILL